MPQQYRILMVSDRYLPIVGGAERQASQLITQLQARGHTIRVVTRRIDASLPQEDVIQGVPDTALIPDWFKSLGKRADGVSFVLLLGHERTHL